MIRILRSAWIWSASATLILLWFPLVATLSLIERDPRRLRTARLFRTLGRVLARVNPWRIHISGPNHFDASRAYVIVSNHQSMADIPVIAHLRLDTKWLTKAELFRVPVVGFMLRAAGDVPVERTDTSKGARAILQCARYLRQGCSVVTFPEGTRSPDGHIRPFNDGPFLLAIREGAPILPLVVEGSGAALPRNSWLFGEAEDIHLHVLEPVSVAGFTTAEVPIVRDAIRQTMVDVLNNLRRAVKQD